MSDRGRYPTAVRERKAFKRAKFAPEVGRHIPRQSGKPKPFIVEWKPSAKAEAEKGVSSFFWKAHQPGQWHRYGKYPTQAAAEAAIRQKKSQFYFGEYFDYRWREE